MTTLNDAYIVAPVRTPIGKFGGGLRALTADQLMVHIVKALLARTGISGDTLDDVIVSQSYSNSEAPCLGRYGALAAGLPIEIPGYTLDRRCGSGLQAVVNAAMHVQTGQSDAIMVVGVESMSNIEYYSTDMRWGSRAGSVKFHDRLDRGRERGQPPERFGNSSGAIESNDILAASNGITREASDAFAARSHANAHAAWENGTFDAEVISIDVPGRKGAVTTVTRDKGIRPDTTPESLATMRALREGGTTTVGNSSQQNDAAAGCLVVSKAYLDKHGLTPMGRLAGWSVVGSDPIQFGTSPVPATQKVLERTGLTLDQMDLIEVNEAFASQALASLKGLHIDDFDRVNVNGSGVSLGHPIGATGVRILTTLLHEMGRRDARYGLETMCIGGGMGMAAVFERP